MPTVTERKRARNPHQPVGRWIRENTRRKIYERDGYKCHKCGKDLRNVSRRNRTLDHKTPVSRGGSNKPSNLRTACRDCNSQRSVFKKSEGQMFVVKSLRAIPQAAPDMHGRAAPRGDLVANARPSGTDAFKKLIGAKLATAKKAVTAAALMPKQTRAKYQQNDYGSDEDDTAEPESSIAKPRAQGTPKPSQQAGTVVMRKPGSTQKSTVEIVELDDLAKARSGMTANIRAHSARVAASGKAKWKLTAPPPTKTKLKKVKKAQAPQMTPQRAHQLSARAWRSGSVKAHAKARDAHWAVGGDKHGMYAADHRRAIRGEAKTRDKKESAWHAQRASPSIPSARAAKSLDVASDVTINKSQEPTMSKIDLEELFSNELAKSTDASDKVIIHCPHCDEGITKSQVIAKGHKMKDENNGGKNTRGPGKDGAHSSATPTRPKGKKVDPENSMPGAYAKSEDGTEEKKEEQPVVKSAAALTGGPRVIGGSPYVQYVDSGEDERIAKSIAEGSGYNVNDRASHVGR